jgi:hypothetical protein
MGSPTRSGARPKAFLEPVSSGRFFEKSYAAVTGDNARISWLYLQDCSAALVLRIYHLFSSDLPS